MIRSVFLFFTLLTLGLDQNASAQTTMQIAQIKGSYNQLVGKKLLIEIYRRLDIDISFSMMTAKRALSETSSGHKDAEVLRVASVSEKYPSLIRIPTPLYSLKSQVFSRLNPSFEVITVEDMRYLRTVIVRGIMHAEALTEESGSRTVHRLETVTKMMQFLARKRADIALSSRLNGLAIIQEQQLTDIIPLGKPILVQPLYHYVHEKHRALVPKINAVIQALRNSGELTQLIQQFEQTLIQGTANSQ